MWIVEDNPAAVKAFKDNNPDATDFQENCVELLEKVKQGVMKSNSSQQIPAKGEVKLFCGGPPCQV